MRKKALKILLGMAAAAFILTGCSSGKSTSAVKESTSADTAGSAAESGAYTFDGTITIICPVKAGGDTDRNARVMAQYMQKYLGVNVVVKNVDGGATVMGLQECLDSKPDGKTLVVNGTDLFVPYMQGSSKINIDSFKTVGIPIIDNTTVLAVNAKSGWKTLEDLLNASKAAPETIEYGGKIGATNQLCGIAMNKEWNSSLKFIDVGNNAAKMTALLGEQTDVINISYGLATDYFSTGEFIPLCLLGSEKNELISEVPTAEEFGLKNVDFSKFFWVGTNPDTPDNIVQALADAMEKVTKDEEFIKTMESYYLTVDWLPRDKGRDFANSMYEKNMKPYTEEFLSNQ